MQIKHRMMTLLTALLVLSVIMSACAAPAPGFWWWCSHVWRRRRRCNRHCNPQLVQPDCHVPCCGHDLWGDGLWGWVHTNRLTGRLHCHWLGWCHLRARSDSWRMVVSKICRRPLSWVTKLGSTQRMCWDVLYTRDCTQRSFLGGSSRLAEARSRACGCIGHGLWNCQRWFSRCIMGRASLCWRAWRSHCSLQLDTEFHWSCLRRRFHWVPGLWRWL